MWFFLKATRVQRAILREGSATLCRHRLIEIVPSIGEGLYAPENRLLSGSPSQDRLVHRDVTETWSALTATSFT